MKVYDAGLGVLHLISWRAADKGRHGATSAPTSNDLVKDVRVQSSATGRRLGGAIGISADPL
jgi:hypothetical protein